MSFCNKCGAELKENTKFCANCGTPVTTSTASTSFDSSAVSSPQRGFRPAGIALLTVLQGIVSFFLLLGGVALIGLGIFLGAGGWELLPADVLDQLASVFASQIIIAFGSAFLVVIGLVMLIVALLGFIMTWGLWSGKSWARTITMILAVIGIIAGIFSLPGSIINIIIDIVILYYLTRPRIRAYYQ